MATQVGLIKLEGTLDGTCFYRDPNGVYRARKATGPSKEEINTNPARAKHAANCKEFGGKSKVEKAMRTALSAVKYFIDRGFAGRIWAKFTMMSRYDGNTGHGKRPVLISEHRGLFKNIEGIGSRHWSSVCNVKYSLLESDQRKIAAVVFHATDAGAIQAPSGATHFCLIHCTGIVSDYYFDEPTGEYCPMIEGFDVTSVSTRSEYIALGENIPETKLTNVVCDVEIPQQVTVIQAVAIEFYQKAGDKFYDFKGNKTMRIVNAF